MKRIAGLLLIVAGVLWMLPNLNQVDMFSFPAMGFSFSTKEINEELSFEEVDFRELKVDVGSTNVNVVRGDSDRIKIRLQGKASPEVANKVKLKAEPEGGQLAVGVESQGNSSFGLIRDLNLTIELSDQLWSAIAIKAGSGDIDLQELNVSSVQVETESGDVHVLHVKAEDFHANTGSGNMNITGVEGAAIGLKADSGDITADRFQAAELMFHAASGNVKLRYGKADVKGETGSGDIRIEAAEWAHDADFKSGSGNVTVALEEEPASLAVEFNSVSGVGRVRWEGMSYEVNSEDHNRIKGAFGSAKDKLNVRTGSGDFTLE